MSTWKISIYEHGDPLRTKCYLFQIDARNMDEAIREAQRRLPEGFVSGSVWAQRVD